MAELPTLFTVVARGGWDEHLFRGHRVFGELAGRDGFWSLVSLALGGPRLDAEAEQVLSDVAICFTAADPRIWPLKVTRLVASYGDEVAALCAGTLILSGTWIGPHTLGGAATFLVELRAELGPECDDPAAVEQRVRARLARGQRLPGFGVPFRSADERVAALQACLVRRGRDQGPHWRLLRGVAAVLAQDKGIPLNVAGAAAAACLDLGLAPRQLHGMPLVFSLCPFLANAQEGAEQAAGLLRRLPDSCVRYVGAPPRRSPRAGRS